MDERAAEILEFWLRGIGEAGWYAPPEGLDETIRDKYLTLWEEARGGGLGDWAGEPRSCLALLLLIDQFPRNMFREDGRAFATDARAVGVAKRAIRLGFDQMVGLPERQFFYLPLMHSETVAHQEKCLRLMLMSFGPGSNLTHARAHRAVIREFGRFPYRNAALGRASTEPERRFLEAGGYAKALRDLG